MGVTTKVGQMVLTRIRRAPIRPPWLWLNLQCGLSHAIHGSVGRAYVPHLAGHMDDRSAVGHLFDHGAAKTEYTANIEVHNTVQRGIGDIDHGLGLIGAGVIDQQIDGPSADTASISSSLSTSPTSG